MTNKGKKIVNIVVDAVVVVILAIVLLLAISTISSRAKGYDGYTAIFGRAYVAVASDSMNGDKDDDFAKGDLIVIKLLSDEEAKELDVNQIVTFRTKQITEDGTYVLNTHRIVDRNGNDETGSSKYVTHGDANPDGVNETVLATDIVGVYIGKASGIGQVFLFMSSSWGFFTCVVVPSLIVVVYFAVNLVLVIRKEKVVQTAAAEEQKKQEREELEKELFEKWSASQNKGTTLDSSDDKGETELPKDNKE
jgi:signal peptidase